MNLKTLNQQPLKPSQLYLLTALLFFAVIPHFFNLSVFISLFFTAVLGLRIISYRFSMKALPRWFILLSLAAGIFIVVFLYSGKIGKDFGVSLLVAMLALKILEVKTRRDAYVLCFITAFMLVTQFLYSQEILFSVYVFVIAFFMLGYLFWLNQRDSNTYQFSSLKTVFRLSAQAVPVMIVLFILFPRLQGPLWGFDQGVSSAVTGISDTLSPGSISQLSRSSATAFRVKFDDNNDLPAPGFRYWRGPVITWTDGFTWKANKNEKPDEIAYQSKGPLVNYQLTIEPTQQHWLFALDLPASLPAKTFVTSNYSVKTEDKINKRSTYALASSPDYVIKDSSDDEILNALLLPGNITSRLSEFVKQMTEQYPSEQAYIQAVLGFFNKENFIYTLSPPQMLNNPADEFFFEHRKGFCEHYASTFVILMRLADIPARIVAGYQGGEWNPTGEHLIVRQSDAHAWTEVWLDDRGWVRIDPTSAVSPERIEQSIDPTTETSTGEVVFKISSDSMLGSLYKEAAWMLDSLDLNWHRWVVGFSQKRQNRLLDYSGLGFLKGYKLGIAAVVLTFVVLIIMTLLFRNRVKDKRDQARIYWDKFTAKLQRKGVKIHTFEGPETIATNATLILPEQKDSIKLITRYYIKTHYGQNVSSKLLSDFKQLVSDFR